MLLRFAGAYSFHNIQDLGQKLKGLAGPTIMWRSRPASQDA